LKKFTAEVTESGVIAASELKAIDDEVMELIEKAVREAKAAPLPTLADLTTDVYVKY
jgi:pyruvate dehydrogenase E1 component alpha subunit